MNQTLFAIGDDICALQDILQEIEGDVSDEQVNEAIDKWFAENEANLDSKLDGYSSLIKEREAIAKARKAEETRIRALRSTDENLVTRLKDRLKNFFESHNIARKETTRFKLWIQSNGGEQPVHFNELEYGGSLAVRLPKRYQSTVVVPNLELIRQDALRLYELEQTLVLGASAWSELLDVEHTELRSSLKGIAHVQPRGTHLRIK